MSTLDNQYKEAWNKLKVALLNELDYRDSGFNQSFEEAVYCRIECLDIIAIMSQLEANIAD